MHNKKLVYLQIPAPTRKTMKRYNPIQTPARPNTGAAASRKIEEINATSTFSSQQGS
jgi:hypothetical protein